MHSTTRRELFTGFQYLLIGVIAEGATLHWFHRQPPWQQMLIWIVIAAAISVSRFLLLMLVDLFRRDQWKNVSRRNWL